jgi:flagellar capping protein FliD
LDSASAFDVFSATSSDEDIVTLKGDVGAVEAMYDIGVYQLARNEKMISAAGRVTSQTAALSSMPGVTVGDISIDGTTITIDADDTIQDVRMKINNATDSDGNRLNVSASVLKVSDSDFRLVLNAKETGSTGVTYEGQTLVDLGIITAASTSGGTVDNKGNTAQVLRSATGITAAFDGLGAGDSIQYTGTDRDGNAVTKTYIKPAADTDISEFIASLKRSFHDMVDIVIDGDASAGADSLVVTDKVKGTSQLTIGSFTLGGASLAFSTATVGDEGAGVLTSGKDAYFNVDGLSLTSSDNDADGFIPGVTVELHKAAADETVQTTLARDTEAIKKKVQELLDAYNAVLTFVDENTKMADPTVKDSKAGDLAGDMTAKSVISQIRNELKRSMNFFGGSFNSLTMFGVKSDVQSGQMSLDEKQFNKALTNNFDEVVRFFVTTGVSDNRDIVFGRNTKDTQSGTYTISRNGTDPALFDILYGSETTAYISDAPMGDIVPFSSGPAKGLALTVASGSLASGTATFTFAKGLGDRISELVDRMNDPGEGIITLHQNSINGSIDSANDRIDTMQKRVDDYHDRLVKQFAAMEDAMMKMQNQMSNMLSALGSSSS